MNAPSTPKDSGWRAERHLEQRNLARRRFMAAGLGITGAAGIAAVTGGILGFGTAPMYQEAPAVEDPFTPEDPDTYKGMDAPGALAPMQMAIPSIGIQASVVDVGLVPGTDAMVIPAPEKVGHYTLAAPIGAAAGSTLIAGHVNKGLEPGALWNLSKTRKGACVYITDSAGRQHTYKVVSARTIIRQPLPADTYALDGNPQLVIVTCAGTPGPDGNVLNYNQNTIVTATKLS